MNKKTVALKAKVVTLRRPRRWSLPKTLGVDFLVLLDILFPVQKRAILEILQSSRSMEELLAKANAVLMFCHSSASPSEVIDSLASIEIGDQPQQAIRAASHAPRPQL